MFLFFEKPNKSILKYKLDLVILLGLKTRNSSLKKSLLKISIFLKKVQAFRNQLNGVINRVNEPKGLLYELLFYLH